MATETDAIQFSYSLLKYRKFIVSHQQQQRTKNFSEKVLRKKKKRNNNNQITNKYNSPFSTVFWYSHLDGKLILLSKIIYYYYYVFSFVCISGDVISNANFKNRKQKKKKFEILFNIYLHNLHKIQRMVSHKYTIYCSIRSIHTLQIYLQNNLFVSIAAYTVLYCAHV